MKQGDMLIAELRSEMGLSLEAFAARIGLASRGRMSVIERENQCSLDVALRIEKLAGGRVNAADLNEDVRAARAGRFHSPSDNVGPTVLSAGKSNKLTVVQQGAGI